MEVENENERRRELEIEKVKGMEVVSMREEGS
jgi:hypothetical protein